MSAFAEVGAKVATFALIVVAARMLNAEDFGAFAYSVAFALLLASAAQWGFDVPVEREGSVHPDQLSRLVFTDLWWRTLVALPLFVLAGTFQWFARPNRDAAIALVLVLIATLIDSYGEIGRSAATARQYQGGVASAQVLQRFTAAISGIVALVAGAGLVGMAFGYLLGSVIGGCAVLMASRGLGIAWEPGCVTRSSLREMWRWSISPGVAAVCAFVTLRLGAVLLGWWRGDAVLAQFSVSFRLVETVLFASWAMRRAAFPIMSSADRHSEVRSSLEQGIGFVAVIYVPFAAIMLIDTAGILDTIYGPPYGSTASAPLRWLALAPLLYGVAHLCAFALLARNRGSRLLIASVVGAMCSVAASIVLIPRYGASGAAAAIVIALAATGGLELLLLRGVIGSTRLVAPLAVPVLVALPLALALSFTPLPGLFEAVVFAFSYCVFWFLVARRSSSDPTSVLSLIQRPTVPT